MAYVQKDRMTWVFQCNLMNPALLRHFQESDGDLGRGGSNKARRQRQNGHPSHWENCRIFEPRLHKSGKSILLKLEHREKLVLADTNASMLPVELDEQWEKWLPTDTNSSLSSPLFPSFCCINIAFAGMNKSPAAGEKSQQKLRLIFCLNFDSRYLLMTAETNSCNKWWKENLRKLNLGD